MFFYKISTSQEKAVGARAVPMQTAKCNHKALRTNQPVCGLRVRFAAARTRGGFGISLAAGDSLEGCRAVRVPGSQTLDRGHFLFSDGSS